LSVSKPLDFFVRGALDIVAAQDLEGAGGDLDAVGVAWNAVIFGDDVVLCTTTDAHKRSREPLATGAGDGLAAVTTTSARRYPRPNGVGDGPRRRACSASPRLETAGIPSKVSPNDSAPAAKGFPVTLSHGSSSKQSPGAIDRATTGAAMDQKSQILSTINEMVTAFHNGDIPAILRTYEPGAAVVGTPGSPVTDRSALESMFAGFIAAKARFTFDGHEVIEAGDLAVHVTPWKMTGTGPDGGPIAASGLSIAVLRRQPDGRWLMVIDNPFGDAVLGARAPVGSAE
jgi:ketosteroid isomerase-like protein